MQRPKWVLIALVTWVLSSTSLAQNPSHFEYVILTEDQVVGSLEVVERSIDVGVMLQTQLNISENGRGPSLRETISFNTEGDLLSWKIEGLSTFGAEVNEDYRFSDGYAHWISASESGERVLDSAPIFVPQVATDLVYAYLIKQALTQGVKSLNVLPFGQVHVEPLDDLVAIADIDGLKAYSIVGLRLEPVFVVVDEDQRLVATLGTRQWVLRADQQSQIDHWIDTFHALTQARLQQLAKTTGLTEKGRVIYDRVQLILPHENEPSAMSRVLVVDGRIHAIAPDLPILDRDLVIDGEGGYLIPGLFDLHVHISPWAGLYHLAAGVTGVRDQGTPATLMAKYLDWHEAGSMLSPTIYPSGLVEGLSPYSTRSGEVVDSVDEALVAIDRYDQLGYRQIKVYNSIRPEWVGPMIERAHALGLKVTGHVPAFMTADEAIEAGYDDISHLNQLMLGWVLKPGEDTRTSLRITAMARVGDVAISSPKPQRTLEQMARHGVSLDTTAMIIERIFLSRSGQVNQADLPYLDHMPIGYQRFRRQAILSINSPVIDQAYRDAVTKSLEVMKAAHDQGVQLLPGTDDGIGFSMHRELELYVSTGIKPADALYLATLGAAKYLGLDDEVGSIEVGKRADLVLLKDNPLEDIRAIRTVRWVSQGHRMLAPQSLHRALGVKPFGTSPSARRADGGSSAQKISNKKETHHAAH